MTANALTTSMGFTGINNPANSCFMNAAVQCLVNTRELRDYFLRKTRLSTFVCQHSFIPRILLRIGVELHQSIGHERHHGRRVRQSHEEHLEWKVQLDLRR